MVEVPGSGRGTHAAGAPRVWLLVADRLGDNAQAEVAAAGLGWPFERKRLEIRERYRRTKPRVRPGVHLLDLARSDPLEPPWPDLVITIGRRLSMVALWIRSQAGPATKLVLLGKPSGMGDHFDLVIPSAENPLPLRPNIFPIGLPLMRPDPDVLAEASTQWKAHFEGLARPLIALLVGGPTKPFLFDVAVAEDLIARAAREAVASGGTLYVTTSPRTSPEITRVLQRGAPPGSIVYRWTPDRSTNPYSGLLALADRFIVTADSISMLVEVARQARPLAIYPLAQLRPWLGARMARRVAAALLSSTAKPRPPRLADRLGYTLYRMGWIRHGRDFTAIHHVLTRSNSAVYLGDALASGSSSGAPDDLPRAVARIRELMGFT